ncbi:hypothetical protein CPB85DRAFT_613500 [Mucidula mucida]|nr:hypothetical protein CPB85DRAFT_613500 [Mucidula mucida]
MIRSTARERPRSFRFSCFDTKAIIFVRGSMFLFLVVDIVLLFSLHLDSDSWPLHLGIIDGHGYETLAKTPKIFHQIRTSYSVSHSLEEIVSLRRVFSAPTVRILACNVSTCQTGIPIAVFTAASNGLTLSRPHFTIFAPPCTGLQRRSTTRREYHECLSL